MAVSWELPRADFDTSAYPAHIKYAPEALEPGVRVEGVWREAGEGLARGSGRSLVGIWEGPPDSATQRTSQLN